ncbi:MAG TPA: hypothetical protein VLE93_00945 [Candidatus Saccharimonadales bacterium]|nr:hypothetical protein [Candidatus Saccharimonadales bacterium]
MQRNSRLLPWFAAIFFALLTFLAGAMLVGQNRGSSLTGSVQPQLNINNLFGITH